MGDTLTKGLLGPLSRDSFKSGQAGAGPKTESMSVYISTHTSQSLSGTVKPDLSTANGHLLLNYAVT